MEESKDGSVNKLERNMISNLRIGFLEAVTVGLRFIQRVVHSSAMCTMECYGI